MKCKEECPIYGNMDKIIIQDMSNEVTVVKPGRCVLDVEGECKALALAKFIKRQEGF